MRIRLSLVVLISVLSTLSACSYTEKITQSILPNSEFKSLVVEGDAAMEAANWTRAISRYQDAIKLNPESLDVRLKLGTAFQRNGKLANAYNEYQQVIQMAEAKGDANNKSAHQAKQYMAKSGFKPTTEEEIIPSPSELFALNTPTPDNPPVSAASTSSQLPDSSKVDIPAVTVVDVTNETTQEKVETIQQSTSIKALSDVEQTGSKLNAPDTMDAAQIQQTIEERILAWKQAWESKVVSSYWTFYTSTFKGEVSSHDAWKKVRKQKIESAKSPQVSIGAIKFDEVGTQRVSVKFKQQYSAGHYSDSGTKTLLWVNENGQWLIAEELFSPVK